MFSLSWTQTVSTTMATIVKTTMRSPTGLVASVFLEKVLVAKYVWFLYWLVGDDDDALCVFYNERPFLPPCSRAISPGRALFIISIAVDLFKPLRFHCTLSVIFLCLQVEQHTSSHNTTHQFTQHHQHHDVFAYLGIIFVTAGSCTIFNTSCRNTKATHLSFRPSFKCSSLKSSPTSQSLSPQILTLATNTLSTSRHGFYPRRDHSTHSPVSSHQICV